MRAPGLWAAALAILALTSHGHAATRYELGFGVTAASSDGPKVSGTALTAAALWEVLPGFEFGLMLFADDLGSRLGRLRDPNDGTDLGTTVEDHRGAFGGAWRADFSLLRGDRWRSAAGVTWGYYRVQDDRVGVVRDGLSAVGVSIGAGVSRRLRPTSAMGLSVRWNQLLEERQDHYVRATVDLMWLPSATAAARTPGMATPGNEN